MFYEECCYGMVDAVLEGFNGTIFAYGQTGCGKTHTMMGPPDDKGVIPNSVEQIFCNVETRSSVKMEYLVRCSFLEIYNEEIRDLLGEQEDSNGKAKKYVLKEDPQKGIYVKVALLH